MNTVPNAVPVSFRRGDFRGCDLRLWIPVLHCFDFQGLIVILGPAKLSRMAFVGSSCALARAHPVTAASRRMPCSLHARAQHIVFATADFASSRYEMSAEDTKAALLDSLYGTERGLQARSEVSLGTLSARARWGSGGILHVCACIFVQIRHRRNDVRHEVERQSRDRSSSGWAGVREFLRANGASRHNCADAAGF